MLTLSWCSFSTATAIKDVAYTLPHSFLPLVWFWWLSLWPKMQFILLISRGSWHNNTFSSEWHWPWCFFNDLYKLKSCGKMLWHPFCHQEMHSGFIYLCRAWTYGHLGQASKTWKGTVTAGSCDAVSDLHARWKLVYSMGQRTAVTVITGHKYRVSLSKQNWIKQMEGHKRSLYMTLSQNSWLISEFMMAKTPKY